MRVHDRGWDKSVIRDIFVSFHVYTSVLTSVRQVCLFWYICPRCMCTCLFWRQWDKCVTRDIFVSLHVYMSLITSVRQICLWWHICPRCICTCLFWRRWDKYVSSDTFVLGETNVSLLTCLSRWMCTCLFWRPWDKYVSFHIFVLVGSVHVFYDVRETNMSLWSHICPRCMCTCLFWRRWDKYVSIDVRETNMSLLTSVRQICRFWHICPRCMYTCLFWRRWDRWVSFDIFASLHVYMPFLMSVRQNVSFDTLSLVACVHVSYDKKHIHTPRGLRACPIDYREGVLQRGLCSSNVRVYVQERIASWHAREWVMTQ